MADIVMQPRCIHCLREQYAIAVWDISHGRSGCVWCGKTPPVFTEQVHYNGALRAARIASPPPPPSTHPSQGDQR